jgi:hypothetical protein
MSLYHQIFIKKTFDTPAKICVLNKFMYSGIGQTPIQAQALIQTPIQRPTPIQIPIQRPTPIQIPIQRPTPIQIPIQAQALIQIPTQMPTQIQAPVRVKEGVHGNIGSLQDTLFWSLYISNYGQTEYESIGHGYSNVEISEKQKIIDFIKKSPNIVKTKVMLQEIMSDLMTNTRITPSTLPALSAFYKKRIIITKRNKFFIELCPPDAVDMETVHLIKNDKGNYSIDYNTPNLDKLIRLNSHDSPLKAISTYKTDELNDIAIRVGIDTTVKRKKAELYQEIVLKCLW